MTARARAPVVPRRQGGALEPARTVLRLAAALAGAGFLAVVVVTPLDLRSQAALAAAMFALSLALGRARGPAARLALVLLSVTATARYLWWRITATVFLEWSADAALGFVLLAAELYSCAMLVLAYGQSVAPLRRKPVPLPDDRSRWPTVDVYVPTYNEPLEVVRTTVLAALALDWPRDRLRVFLLDDGRRPAFRAFASEAGVGYLTREDNAHAKAGNLNHALKLTQGEFIAIFDCDHVPTRSFLQVTMGGFLRDPRLALVQTPHHFYSPDPFVRNLDLPRSVPSENELFYGVIQRGLDTWNAAFFCGSCAVLRRSALEEVGGIAVETVTEDAHTALKMHRRGWRSAYLDIPQAAGLSTESLSAHVGQRIRWARGMAQMFRIDNPLLGRGLRLSQRLSYLAAMLHFFSGVPRLVFLIAPIAYLLFGRHVFNALPLAALAYGFPHLLHSTATNAHLHGRFRHSFWSEVYETSLAWYIAIPTTLALLAPSAGRFNVTAKGGRIEEPFFDARIALPYLGLTALNLVALGAAGWQLWLGVGEVDALAINIAWTIHNLVILSATLAVACERRQLRGSARVTARLPALLRPAQGRAVQCRTVDLSRGGASLEMSWRQGACVRGEPVSVALLAPGGERAPAWLPALVVSDEEATLRLRFAPLDLAQESELVRAIFSRPDAWSSYKEALRPDRPLATLAGILRHGLLGVGRALRLSARAAAPRRPPRDQRPEPLEEERDEELGGGGRRPRLRTTLLVLAAALAAGSPARAQQSAEAPQTAAISTRMLAVGPTDEQRLARASVLELPFGTRADEDPAGARVKVAFAKEIPPGAPGVAGVEVVLNDQRAGLVEAGPGREATVALDPALLAARNLLSVRLLDRDGRPVAQRGGWGELASVDLYLDTTPAVLPDDLALLPLPFIDRGLDTEATIPIALPAPATPERVRLAALVASWIALDSPIPVTFTVSVGSIPDGRAVVLVDDEGLAAGLGLAPLGGPLVRMADHPRRAASSAKLLVVGGRTPAELRAAVESLVARPERLVGREVRLEPAAPGPPAAPYSAPRWLPPGRMVRFRDLPLAGTSSHDGATSTTLSVRFRVAPDLAVWPADSVVMDLGWSQRLPAGVAAPRLDVELNGYFLTTLPPPPGPGESARELRLWIPREHLRGFNELLLHVKYPDAPGRGGPAGAGAGARVAISGGSALHLEGIGQFATLPDTGMFAYDGYPFTRVPDLGETAVVLPREPGGAELSAALTLVAQFAQITGRVGTRASFVTADDGDAALAGKDVLAIGTAADQPLIGRWRARWPLDVTARRPRVQAPSGGPGWLELAGGLGRVLDRRRAEAVLDGAGEVGVVMGIESPLSPGRCVVAVTGTPGSTLPPFREFLGYAESRNLTGHDLLLLSGGRRFTFRIGPPFTRGQLEPWNRARWFLANHWLLLVPVLIVGVAALGRAGAGTLRARMRERLALGGSP